MKIIKMQGQVLLMRRKWYQLYKVGWCRHNDLWNGKWWIRFNWDKKINYETT